MFENNLSTMTVSDGENTETFTDMVFVQQMEWADGTFYLAFRELSSQEKVLGELNDMREAMKVLLTGEVK